MSDYTVTVTALDEVDNEWSADYTVTVLGDGRRDTWDEPGYDPDLDLELIGVACESLEAERCEHGAILDDLMDKAWDAAVEYYWDNYSYGEDE
jgi:hypothetical protein